MDAQASLTSHSETALLVANVHGEKWALKAYAEALAEPSLTDAMRQEVARQQGLSQDTHQHLQKLAE